MANQRYAKGLIYLYLTYLVVEGALRKWVIPDLTTELFLLKDLLLFLGIVPLLLMAGGERFRWQGSGMLFLIWGGWTFLITGLLVVSEFSMESLAGFRYYVAYLPLLILVPKAFTNIYDLNSFGRVYVYLAGFVCLLGIVQYYSPTDSLINTYAWRTLSLDVASFGELERDSDIARSRITGTFSYISPYAVYLQFVFLVVLALLVQVSSQRKATFLLALAALVFINLAMTGSRGPLLVCSIVGAPLLVLALRLRRIGPLPLAVLALAIAAAVYIGVFELLYARNESAADAGDRIAGALLGPFYTFRAIDILGAGIGTTFLGLGESLGTGSMGTGFDEVFLDRVGIELGYFPYAFVLTAKISIMIATLSIFIRLRDPGAKAWALVSLGYQASSVWQIPFYNSTAGAFYFFSVALFPLLCAKAAAERRSPRPAAAQTIGRPSTG